MREKLIGTNGHKIEKKLIEKRQQIFRKTKSEKIKDQANRKTTTTEKTFMKYTKAHTGHLSSKRRSGKEIQE